jgi:hypothetical protein
MIAAQERSKMAEIRFEELVRFGDQINDAADARDESA